MSSLPVGIGGPGDEDEQPVAQFQVKEVPRHYLLNATLTFDGMFGLILGLRRLVDEYDVPVCEQLLEACRETFGGDLPSIPSTPIDEDEQPTTG